MGEAGRVRNKPEVQGANPGDQRSNEHRVKKDGSGGEAVLYMLAGFEGREEIILI